MCRMADRGGVLFDLDGVLVDSRVPFARGVNGALVSQGLPPRPEQELHQYLGPPLHRTFRALVGEESLVQPCVDCYRARYRELAASETTVFPGIREVLDELSGQVPLVIATSKPRALAEPLLDALDLRRFFGAVVGPALEREDEQKAVTVGRALREFASEAPRSWSAIESMTSQRPMSTTCAPSVCCGASAPKRSWPLPGPTHSSTPPPNSGASSRRRADKPSDCGGLSRSLGADV